MCLRALANIESVSVCVYVFVCVFTCVCVYMCAHAFEHALACCVSK